MRDPNNLHKSYELEEVPAIIKIDELPDYTMFDYDLNDEKSLKKYFQSIEKNVRGSYEYRAMVQYLKDYIDMNKCSFYMNVNNIDSSKIKIEIHHEPLSLYDICIIVYNKRVAFRESLEEELVAKEVMYLHYDLQVGLIPLAETVHELVHNQYLFVPTSNVYGKYKEFIDRYKAWMLPEQIDILERIEQISSDYEDNYKDILAKHFIYVDMSGSYTLPRTEDIINIIKVRINELINNPQKLAQQSLEVPTNPI